MSPIPPITPTNRFVNVTKSDTAKVIYTCQDDGGTGAPLVLREFKGILVGTVGDVAVKNDVGTSVIHYNLAAGVIHAISGSMVMSTGTEPTEITAYF